MKQPFANEAEQKIHRVSLSSKRVSLLGKFPVIEAATGVVEEKEMGRLGGTLELDNWEDNTMRKVLLATFLGSVAALAAGGDCR